ncbi:13258_t:CDS:2 [Entrophospora sp. SA101]|nr:7976_t:CDS:2 [Entrophospora sp. SA101]CAJ0854424.1 13258_t:CDS:2 [Entrophospora sp. SA101]
MSPRKNRTCEICKYEFSTPQKLTQHYKSKKTPCHPRTIPEPIQNNVLPGIFLDLDKENGGNMKLHYQIKTLPNLFIFILLRSETTSLILKKNNRKRPLNTPQSKSAVNKRLRDFGKDAKNLIDSLIESYNMNEEESHAISLHNLELDCNTEKIMINYKQMYERREIDAIVRACDESFLSREPYQHLAAIDASLVREYIVSDHRNTITNSINNDLNIKTFSIDKIVNDLEMFEESEKSEIIKFGDTLMLKLGGDGYNIGHKQNHVMFTVCLLNQGEEVLKPENQHW